MMRIGLLRPWLNICCFENEGMVASDLRVTSESSRTCDSLGWDRTYEQCLQSLSVVYALRNDSRNK